MEYYIITYYESKEEEKREKCSIFLIDYYSELWRKNKECSFNPDIKEIRLIKKENGIEKIIIRNINRK